MVVSMASITLNDIPEDLHAQLKAEAEANYRSLDQEALARLQRSLDADVATRRDQSWVDEAMASGPAEPFSREKFFSAIQGGLAKAKEKSK
jgi:hypothetical protein